MEEEEEEEEQEEEEKEEEEEEEEEEGEAEEEEEEQLWAQCDACGKWRRLPESMRGAGGARWQKRPQSPNFGLGWRRRGGHGRRSARG